uniref:Uncharacterized protein n=1 Tax=Nymphaea colorata TaxID=210225 RepID=A0A5K0VYW3_9MAGN
MPFVANVVVWRSLLSLCVAHGDLHVVNIAAQQLLSVERDSAEIYIMLANIYEKNGRFEESRDIPGSWWAKED